MIREALMARTKAVLGDVRRDARADWMLERIVASGSLVVREFAAARGGEIAAHRFLSSKKVGASSLLKPHTARTAAAAKGLRIVAVQDTTEINFSGRDKRRKGLGPAGDGVSKGFFIHPVIAVDADSEALLGVAGATIWTRDEVPSPPHKGRPLADKESLRWLESARSAVGCLGGTAAGIVVVGDRESDIYPLFARRPEAAELVVRARADRKCGDGGLLFSKPGNWPELGRTEVKVAPRGPGDKGRKACAVLKAGRVTILRPEGSGYGSDPKALTLGFVEVKEAGGGAAKDKPLLWRLITTLPVDTLADAMEVVRLYRLRWRIEEVFRVLKSDGLKLEDSQIEDADRLFNLSVLGLVAAARIIQLVDARDGSERTAADVIDPSEFEAAAAIGTKLEGGTERQKNPHAKGSLAWLAWIAARLGGWNCYYKPPGPKTMARGLDRLLDRIAGYKTAKGDADV